MKEGIIIAIIAALGICGYGWYAEIRHGAEQNAALQAKSDALERAARRVKSDAKALVAREAEIASKRRILIAEERRLQNALQRNIDWRNTNVPDDVQKALGGAGNGLPEGFPRNALQPVDLDGLLDKSDSGTGPRDTSRRANEGLPSP